MQNIMADYELSQKSREFLDSRDSVPKSSLMSLKIKNIVQSMYSLFVRHGVTKILTLTIINYSLHIFKDLLSGKQK